MNPLPPSVTVIGRRELRYGYSLTVELLVEHVGPAGSSARQRALQLAHRNAGSWLVSRIVLDRAGLATLRDLCTEALADLEAVDEIAERVSGAGEDERERGRGCGAEPSPSLRRRPRSPRRRRP